MPKPQSDRRGVVYPDEMETLVLGEGWGDGRKGFQYCRIEAVLDQKRKLRVEVTWNDNSDFTDDRVPTMYFDPLVTLETNRTYANDPDDWRTFDAVHINVAGDFVRDLVQAPAREVLDQFEREILSLKVWEDRE